MPRPRDEVLFGGLPRNPARTVRPPFVRVVNIPTPEWIKELLGPTPKVEPSEPVPEPESATTDVPEDVQDEIRELAAAEAEALVVEPPEEIPEEEALPEAPEEPEDVDQAEVPEAEPEAEAEEAEPKEPPKTPRTPRRFEFAFKASSLKAFVAQIEHLVDEAKVVADKDGWHVRAVDPAHVAMVELHLTDLIDGFERVRSTNALERIDGPVEFGIDLTKMREVLRLAKKDETVAMTADLPDDEDRDRIAVSIGRTTRTMAAIDTSGMSDPRVPVLNLPAKLTVAAEDLLEAAKACESIADHARLTASREGLNVFAEGDTDKVSFDLEADVAYVQGEEGNATSLFPLDYLSAFVKAAKTGPLVVQLGTDYPIRVDWDGPTKGTWLCAPRIETDE